MNTIATPLVDTVYLVSYTYPDKTGHESFALRNEITAEQWITAKQSQGWTGEFVMHGQTKVVGGCTKLEGVV